MDWQAFFAVHSDLPREGPGEAADVAWALTLAGLGPAPVIADVGAGPGGDVAGLLAAPGAQVLALDTHPGFVAQGRARFADVPCVTFEQGDMVALPDHPRAPFDMIWCAGALYFLGLDHGLATMARALMPGGVLAFSEPVFFTDMPSEAARAFWEGYPTRTEAGIAQAIAAAGFETLGRKPLSDAAWEAYYQPMEARIDQLRPDADAALSEMLDLCAKEARSWRAVRAETGYLLSVVRRR